jgi:hypothetical protein
LADAIIFQRCIGSGQPSTYTTQPRYLSLWTLTRIPSQPFVLGDPLVDVQRLPALTFQRGEEARDASEHHQWLEGEGEQSDGPQEGAGAHTEDSVRNTKEAATAEAPPCLLARSTGVEDAAIEIQHGGALATDSARLVMVSPRATVREHNWAMQVHRSSSEGVGSRHRPVRRAVMARPGRGTL